MADAGNPPTKSGRAAAFVAVGLCLIALIASLAWLLSPESPSSQSSQVAIETPNSSPVPAPPVSPANPAARDQGRTQNPPPATDSAYPTPPPILNHTLQKILGILGDRSPELQQWATRMDAGDATDIPKLTTQIAAADFNAADNLQIGRDCVDYGEWQAASLWISAGVETAKAELANVTQNDATVNQLLQTLSQAQDSIAGQDSAGPLLEQINALIMPFDRLNRRDQIPEWARLHHAEALIKEERYVDAQAEADAMNLDSTASRYWIDSEKQVLLQVNAKIPIDPSAQTPADVLTAHDPVPQELLKWATDWQSSHPSSPTTRPDDNAYVTQMAMRDLSELIAKSGLNARECLRLSRMMDDARDWDSEETFAAAGADLATAELADKQHDDLSVLSLIYALQSEQDVLWFAEGDDMQRGVTLEKINAQLMRFDRVVSWDQRIEWAKLAHAEAVYMQGRYAESLAEAQEQLSAAAIDTNYVDVEKVGIEWLEALDLDATHRSHEAVPLLESVANFRIFHHSEDAWPMLINALCADGRGQDAKARLEEYVKRYAPPYAQYAQPLMVVRTTLGYWYELNPVSQLQPNTR